MKSAYILWRYESEIIISRNRTFKFFIQNIFINLFIYLFIRLFIHYYLKDMFALFFVRHGYIFGVFFWNINHCGLLDDKSIFILTNSSISNNSV